MQQPDLRRTIAFAVFQQILLLFVLALADYEYGDLLFICIRTLPAFWGGAALIWLRRRDHPTPVDLFFIRWGYVPLCLVAVLITKGVWTWRGLEWLGF